MSRAYDRTVMFVIESGATKVDESDVSSFHTSRIPPLEKKDLFLKHFRIEIYSKRRILRSNNNFNIVVLTIAKKIPFYCYMYYRNPNRRIECSPAWDPYAWVCCRAKTWQRNKVDNPCAWRAPVDTADNSCPSVTDIIQKSRICLQISMSVYVWILTKKSKTLRPNISNAIHICPW